MHTRRQFLYTTTAACLLAALPLMRAAAAGDFPVTKTPEEWKAILSDEQFRILRKHGTEPSNTSPLNNEHRAGIFHCVGCDNAVYSSETKFDSGTGWPSFYAPVSDTAVGTSTDFKLIYPRTEVHCANCGGHLGHIFKDGPKPTGLRHCINGTVLVFKLKAV